MLTDIGLIVGLYAFTRLALEIRTAPVRSPFIIFTLVVMALIALLTLDIFLIGTDWLVQETQGLR